MYSLDEVLGLFDLKYNITVDDLKRAKKKVLMLHPDKSKLSSEYFLFYKKAFDIIVQFYENQNKQNKAVENVEYKPLHGELNKTKYILRSFNRNQQTQNHF
jgi:hypothetical protein